MIFTFKNAREILWQDTVILGQNIMAMQEVKQKDWVPEANTQSKSSSKGL